jgi:hypothetical protein
MNAILLALVLTAVSPAFEAKTLDGRTISGAIVEASTESVALADKETVSLPVGQLLSITQKQSPNNKKTQNPKPAGDTVTIVELADGAVIYAAQCTTHKRKTQIVLADGQTVEVAADAIRSIRYVTATAAVNADDAFLAEWDRIAAKKTDSDVLVVRKKGSLDYHQGAIGDVAADAVQFELSGQSVAVKRSKIYGVLFHRGNAAKPASVCRITDAAGSVWPVKTMTVSVADGKMQWTTPSGMAASCPLENILQIDFSAGKLVYLSDLKPESTAWKPYFNAGEPSAMVKQFHMPRFDIGFDGRPLQLAQTTYRKGVALRAGTEIVYRPTERFSRFQAEAGIDDAVRSAGGKVHLTVLGDDKMLFEADIAAKDALRSVDVDLGDARRVTLRVDYAGFNAGDHLLLVNARLRK